MERLWSQAGATGGQTMANGAPPKTAQTSRNRWQPTATVSERMVRRGRRFESVRGLCKSPARRRFCVQVDLHVQPRAVGMEPFMELLR
jgi:hypothetical protein